MFFPLFQINVVVWLFLSFNKLNLSFFQWSPKSITYSLNILIFNILLTTKKAINPYVRKDFCSTFDICFKTCVMCTLNSSSANSNWPMSIWNVGSMRNCASWVQSAHCLWSEANVEGTTGDLYGQRNLCPLLVVSDLQKIKR